MGNFTSIQEITMRKIVPGNFRRRQESCGNGVAYVLSTSGLVSHDRFGVVGILVANDGRGCGSGENIQSLMDSCERWVAKNFSR